MRVIPAAGCSSPDDAECSHDPSRWEAFQRKYFQELDAQPDACRAVADTARQQTVTLLYAARDPEHNNARALKTYLEERFR